MVRMSGILSRHGERLMREAMTVFGPRNWRIFPGHAPGDPVAEHSPALDRGQPLEQAGVQRSIRVIRPTRTGATQAIRLIRQKFHPHPHATGEEDLATFNPGQARWYALRLIEAAAIAEVLADDNGEWSASALFDHKQLADWFLAHPELIAEGSAGDNAIRWLEQFLILRGAYERLEASSRERPGRKLRQWIVDHEDFLGYHDESIADVLIPMLDRYVELSLTKATEVNVAAADRMEAPVKEARVPRHKWYGTLVCEAEPTRDGRLIRAGGILIPTALRQGTADPLPLMQRGGMPVGVIQRVWRDLDDRAIRAEGYCELSPGTYAVGADLHLDTSTHGPAPTFQLVIDAARLAGATVIGPGAEPAWPRAVIVVTAEEV